jgi:NAD(P)-dependent dehydrogenase (short-subunit alcohol dehydrogenase family)
MAIRTFKQDELMDNFGGKLAVITGGGTGMGRALALQLVAEGCDVAMCDVSSDNLAECSALCGELAPQGVRVTTHIVDVADRDAVQRFRDEVETQHQRGYINLLFNNAGIGGGGSFLTDPEEQWERTYNICWGGVYNGTRAFMPLLVAADEAHLINTSSINGFWATMGPGRPHTAYSAAKFAVKGFTEALLNDLRTHAPHVGASVVMPGHIGTSILINSAKLLDRADPLNMSGQADLNEEGQALALERALAFRDHAPMTADQAATVILDGVRQRQWRILIGEDAHTLDQLVRESPEEAYEESFVARWAEQRRPG